LGLIIKRLGLILPKVVKDFMYLFRVCNNGQHSHLRTTFRTLILIFLPNRQKKIFLILNVACPHQDKYSVVLAFPKTTREFALQTPRVYFTYVFYQSGPGLFRLLFR